MNSQIHKGNRCESSNYYYEVVQINVIVSGFYTFAKPLYDGIYGDLYNDHFNPFNLSENLFSKHYNNHSCSYEAMKLFAYLQSNSTYILVVTTSYPETKDKFWFFAFGPNNVTFNRIREYLYILNT